MARLLIVDDNHDTLAWMESALREAGHEVRLAASAQSALSLLDHWLPDLVLADILMPETDGWAFSRMVARYGIPFMFVTVVPAAAEGVLRGCSGFLRKPVTPRRLREAVTRALSSAGDHPTILVTDDDPEMRFAFTSILEPSFDVLQAKDGAEALALLKTHDVALLITDVRMPVMDGRELVRRVRQDPALRELPILVQTGDRAAARLPIWAELQIEQVMTKDTFVDWLLARIDQRMAMSGSAELRP